MKLALLLYFRYLIVLQTSAGNAGKTQTLLHGGKQNGRS
jgi:hypothetical protein